jgi:hypothetical protein
MSENLRFHFITAVWGEAYTELFLRLVLPNQLSAGNLGFFRDKPGSATFKVYTTQRDAERIRASPAYARLAEAVTPDISLVEDIDLSGKYSALTQCHRRAIASADAVGAALVFLSPDLIWSDGTFRRLWQLAHTGTRVVMVGSIRVAKETFVPEYLARHLSPAVGMAGVGSRPLVALALKHLHPLSQSLFWDSDRFDSIGPSHLYWRVGSDGMLVRAFHLHPLMVNPVVRGLLPSSTIDADYTPLACPDPRAVYVVQDSDEIAGFEISARGQFGSFRPKRARVADVAFYARYWTQAHHLNFVDRSIRIHAGELSSAWHSIERESDEVVAAVHRYLRWPAVYLGPKIAARSARKAIKYALLPLIGSARVQRLKKRLTS